MYCNSALLTCLPPPQQGLQAESNATRDHRPVFNDHICSPLEGHLIEAG